MVRLAALTLTFGCLLMGSARAQEAGTPVNFLPPLGWQKFDFQVTSATVRTLGAWIARTPAPGAFVPNIILGMETNASPLDDYMSAANVVLMRTFPDAKILAQDRITICTMQPAVDQTVVATMGGRLIHIEQVITALNQRKFIATYVRTDAESDIPEARTALRTMCASSASPDPA